MPLMKKREIFLVDRALQFKYAIILGVMGLMVSVIISFIFYNYMIAHSNVLLISGLDQSEDIVNFFNQQQKLLLIKLFSISVIITLFMFLVGLVISNKIAGSLFSIKRTISEIAVTGDLSHRFRIRKKDELGELVYDLNRLMERLDFEHGSKSDNELREEQKEDLV
jgi:methyl-accepting chemotaxis protein